MCDQVHNGVILIEILLVDPTFVPSVDRSPLPARSDRRWCDLIPVLGALGVRLATTSPGRSPLGGIPRELVGSGSAAP